MTMRNVLSQWVCWRISWTRQWWWVLQW